MIIQPEQIESYSLQTSKYGDDIRKLLSHVINSADAGSAVKKFLSRDQNHLTINHHHYDLDKHDHIYIYGTGKAVIPMASAVWDVLGDRITRGEIITAQGYSSQLDQLSKNIKISQAQHPVPTQANFEVGKAFLSSLFGFGSADLVIFLLSGGGSALMINPAPGISHQDLQQLTMVLLKTGASISEINTIRKHLDEFKGGGIAKLLYPATVETLLLSDVVGDDLDVIASGPTVSDPTTFRDAWNILEKYKIIDITPPPIVTHIISGMNGEVHETLKPGDPIFNKVHNTIIGNNQQILSYASQEAQLMGYHTRILSTELHGEASVVGAEISALVRSELMTASENMIPQCWIAGGETTVTITGSGKGGRNQELAIGSVCNLSGIKNIILVSLATDGIDGPTDAAGAVVTSDTYSRGLSLGLNPRDFLDNNDSYNYFEVLNDLIKTGPTLTNVNDLLMILAH